MKKGLRLTDEKDLKKRRNSDDYFREKILKHFIMWAAIAIITFVGLLFIIRCLTDQMFQYAVLDLVKQNISGIVFTSLSILGFSQYIKRQ